ncbi:MAG: hypothetical protein RR439_03785 [Carnobacterium sp.]
MVYVKGKEVFTDINFLKSQKFISFTQQVDATHEGAVDGVVPAGSIFPKNDDTAVGITINDVTVSNGPQPVGVIVEGYVLKDRLPILPTAEAIAALKEIKFY